GKHMTTCFEFLSASVNELPFCFLRRIGSLDCLDRAGSILVPYPHDPNRIMDIKQYCFRKKLVPDPAIFVIPEDKGGLFATDSAKTDIEKSGLKGFYFSEPESPN